MSGSAGAAGLLARSTFAPWGVRRVAAKQVMQQRSPRRLAARQEALDYCPRRLAAGTRLRPDRAQAPAAAGPIWQFWADGAAAAPAIVRRCLDSADRHRGGRERVLLTATNYRDYVDVPAVFIDKCDRMGWTHFSDVLRVCVLAEHGGTWLDATVLQVAPVPEDVLAADLFLFRRQPGTDRLVASWFIHARRGSPLVLSTRQALMAYWQVNDRLRRYFLLHQLIEASVVLHADVRAEYDQMPVAAAAASQRLQARLDDPFDPDELRRLASRSWLHKLTYKNVRSEVEGALTQFGALERGLVDL